ncbi:aminotransferase [Spirochaetia bacterium]|nr:aminotransferase [Spirochaetia bacterium]
MDMTPTYMTRPLLPSSVKFMAQVKDVFDSGWLTNNGQKHKELEDKLKIILKVQNLSLFNNGTIALLVALKAFDFPPGSEIITTPWTFPATPHCITWNGFVPVFCDIERETMNIDTAKIEHLITEKTRAILGVHVYGFPCNVAEIERIAGKHNLKVIYDAAHAFTTEINGRGIGSFGDISMFSFHATKLFHTMEGGALAYNDTSLAQKIRNLRNFGIASEDYVGDIGINGKMNEIQAVMGLLNLGLIDDEKRGRASIKRIYDERLSRVKGIRVPKMPDNVTHSYQYYPIVIENGYPLTRDEIYEKFREMNIMVRKYFYPACSDYDCYKNLPSARAENIPATNDIKNRVLCLPFYGTLEKDAAERIAGVLEEQ